MHAHAGASLDAPAANSAGGMTASRLRCLSRPGQQGTLLTLSEACCSMLRIQLRMLLKDVSSVTSYTSRMPIAPR